MVWYGIVLEWLVGVDVIILGLIINGYKICVIADGFGVLLNFEFLIRVLEYWVSGDINNMICVWYYNAIFGISMDAICEWRFQVIDFVVWKGFY